jgi:hypothetical protein
VKLPIKKLLVFFFFARQGLSGPCQIRSSSSSDIDLIILVLRKIILIINRLCLNQMIYSTNYIYVKNVYRPPDFD